MTRMKRIGAIALVVVVVLAGLTYWTYRRLRGDGGPRLPTELAVSSFGDSPILVTLKAGTIVDSSPVTGWSDPILKTITYVESGDVDTLPAFARKTASRFRTVILADVRRDEKSKDYRLRRIGVGLCLDVKGNDTVISQATLKEQRVELSFIDTLVLGRAERALGRSHLAAKTPTFALYDTFVELADTSGSHRSILLRYAILVDSSSGNVQTAYWTMRESVGQREVPETITIIPPRSVFQCGIHIQARRAIGSIVSSWGFAMAKLPTGESIAMPSKLSKMALREAFDDNSGILEKAVREALKQHTKPVAK